jgi:N-acylglucosamine-6-phosphate 2-epimerase
VNHLLERLLGGLIVSVQAPRGSALDDPYIIGAMAHAAQLNGAVAVRIEGVENLRAVRGRVGVPIVGLIKRHHAGFEPYITPSLDDVRAVVDTGAEIVAFDATGRPLPDDSTVADAIGIIHSAGRLAMADCATYEDGNAAAAAGADIVATTLCGYTLRTKGHPLPALDMVSALRRSFDSAREDSGDAFLVCEGGVRRPEQVGEALRMGADAVVVGTAITNVDALVREFAGAAQRLR